MSLLTVHLFKGSLAPFMSLLDTHNVPYVLKGTRAIAGSGAPEVLEIPVEAEVLLPLVKVVLAYLSSRSTRKVTLTIGNKVVQVEGLLSKGLSRMLAQARSMVVIETEAGDALSA